MLCIKAHGGLAAQTRLKRLEQERREAETAEKEQEAEHMRLKLIIAEAEKVIYTICICSFDEPPQLLQRWPVSLQAMPSIL